MSVGLNCIAITDHNFASREFLVLLHEANQRIAAASGSTPIHIFPGFELEADIGKGIHALALFDAGTPLDAIDHKLTECGVPYPRFDNRGAAKSSTHNLREIIGVVQSSRQGGRLSGLIICAHPNGAHGLFDNNSIAEWLQKEEWTNNDLLAVEIPKPVEQMKEGWRALFANGDDCSPDWRRVRPIGRFMSSDCKAYTEAENAENYIGKRYCWVKMSSPSIESLRQACLDHESRTGFLESPPELLHTYIKSISISGAAFLVDQSIAFSPELNCIIGGRGSGKSTVLEYLRIALRAFPQGHQRGGAAAKQIERIRSTLGPLSLISLTLVHRGVEEHISLGGQGPGEVVGRDVEDQDTVFRQFGVLAFSQDEISEIASERSFITILDEPALSKLADLRRREADITGELRSLYASRQSRIGLAAELTSANQSLSEVQRQLRAMEAVQQEVDRVRLTAEELVAGHKFGRSVDRISGQLGLVIDEIDTASLPLPSAGAAFSPGSPLHDIQRRVVDSVARLRSELSLQRDQLVASCDLSESGASMTALAQAAADAHAQLEIACNERGISSAALEQLNELAQQQAQLMGVIAELGTRIQELVQEEGEIPNLESDLFAAWEERAQIRRDEIARILASPTMPRTGSGKPILAPSIVSGGDRAHFLDFWMTYSPDGRTKLGRSWNADDGLGTAIFDGFLSSGIPGNPVWWLESRLNDPSLPCPEAVEDVRDDLLAYREDRHDRWTEMLLFWNEDAGDIQLLRTDDSVAGSLGMKDLSDGQRNTAILSLLLARGEGPILIDQPESELDSSFLFTELVPMLRQAKKSRQLIVVTHNANIPVNGDAEMVYALYSSSGKGVPKAEGGLDREEVTQAIVDIMEGSHEAFRRRREKYDF
jgi:predicted ATPase